MQNQTIINVFIFMFRLLIAGAFIAGFYLITFSVFEAFTVWLLNGILAYTMAILNKLYQK